MVNAKGRRRLVLALIFSEYKTVGNALPFSSLIKVFTREQHVNKITLLVDFHIRVTSISNCFDLVSTCYLIYC